MILRIPAISASDVLSLLRNHSACRSEKFSTPTFERKQETNKAAALWSVFMVHQHQIVPAGDVKAQGVSVCGTALVITSASFLCVFLFRCIAGIVCQGRPFFVVLCSDRLDSLLTQKTNGFF